jgi:protein-tyrosine phosphatase
VHCWGGKGRTGTVVGCWLMRHGKATSGDVLRTIQQLRKDDPTWFEPSPETERQRWMVKTWKAEG